ncbi:MAG: hypothetical protein JNK17_17645 [Hydrogenophaga sp.]|nr:hypothetical protein [Hydrogenophaga sp.]
MAESIVKTEIRATTVGRAGAGVYLWAYVNDASEAEHLAIDWYEDQSSAKVFERHPKQGRVLLYYELELEPQEVVNINTTYHHELIRKKVARGRSRSDISRAYDDHISGISEHRLEKFGVPLKLVEASLPVPNATRERSSGVPLTVGADAYIVLATGISSLKLVDVKGMPWKGK